MNDSRLREVRYKAFEDFWKGNRPETCPDLEGVRLLARFSFYAAWEAALASQPSDLRAKLEALRELSEKATAGPWHLHSGQYSVSDGLGFMVCSPNHTIADRHIANKDCQPELPDNGAFIVACVNAVRAILDGKG